MASLNVASREIGRLNVRLSPEIKARVSRAAGVLGLDLTEFTAVTLNERAEEVLARHDSLQLTEAERRFFLDFLSRDSDREPSKKALDLAAKYKSGKMNDQEYEFPD